MHPGPRTVTADTFVNDALALMESHKITSLVVTGSGEDSGNVLGIVHMHDLLQSLGAARTG